MNRSEERMLPLPLLAREASVERFGRRERHPSDEDLLERLQVKDPQALDALFGRYARLVMGIALRTLRDHGEAEDTVQETFLFLYRKAALFDAQKGTAKAWIVQVAFHRALDKRSYLARRGFYVGTDIDMMGDTLKAQTDLDQEVGSRLNRAKLEEAFTELPHAQRQTLEMFFFEGLELREIAGKLNESLGNVRHYYYRGLERLRATGFVRTLRKEKNLDTRRV
jgi:RNA polymerase sigma-70 factor (ECF subfamily)